LVLTKPSASLITLPSASNPSYCVAILASISATSSALPISFKYFTKADIEPFKLALPTPDLKLLETIECKYSWPITFVASVKPATCMLTYILFLPSLVSTKIPSDLSNPLFCFSISFNLLSESTYSTSKLLLLKPKNPFCLLILSVAFKVLPIKDSSAAS